MITGLPIAFRNQGFSSTVLLSTSLTQQIHLFVHGDC
jgi:hypothetical protein